MSRAVVLALALALVGPGLVRPAEAQIYRFTDERGTSHYVDGLDNVPERFRAGATPLGLRNSPPPPAPAPGATGAAAAKPAPSGGTTIQYVPGHRIMVDAKINGSGGARLLLDTGADRTLISPRALQAAGVSISNPVATGQMVGATGTDKIDYVVIESLEVGSARVGRMPVGSYELPAGSDGDGLLGRDFLDQFDMKFEAAKGEVTLAPK